jgi:magnesium transporter
MILNMVRFDGAERGEPFTDAQRADPGPVIAAAKRSHDFVWIGLSDPDGDEMAVFADLLGLHPLAVADATTGKQQPKIQLYKEHLFIVMWAIETSSDLEVGIENVFLFVRDGLLLTVQRGGEKDGLDIEHTLSTTPVDIRGGVMAGVYAIMAEVAKGYAEFASEIETDLQEVEGQVFNPATQEDEERIYRLRQRVAKTARAVGGLATALKTSRDHFTEMAVGNESVEPYLNDLLDDLLGTDQLLKDQVQSLDAVVSTHENNVARRQNTDTRKISALAALLSVPAVFAGIFGMNFKNLPGVSWSFGWEALLITVIVIDSVLFWSFRRRHWI